MSKLTKSMLVIAVALALSSGIAMAETATCAVGVTVPEYIAIAGLEYITLTLPGNPPCTATGSDDFNVLANVNTNIVYDLSPLVSSAVGNPPLSNSASVSGTKVGTPGTTTCTVNVTQLITLQDAPDGYAGTLTVTVSLSS